MTPTESDALAAEREFFAALLDARPDVLDRVLADDFMLIDVMTGSEVPRSMLLELVESGQLRFHVIEPIESRVRLYGTTAVITGRTRMHGNFGEQSFATSSRYTHVYVEQLSRWRLAAAQGTPITGE